MATKSQHEGVTLCPARGIAGILPNQGDNKMNKFIFRQTVYERTTVTAASAEEAWELFECGNLQPECEGDEIICEEQS